MEYIINIDWEKRINASNKKKQNKTAREIIDCVLRELEEEICVGALIQLKSQRRKKIKLKDVC